MLLSQDRNQSPPSPPQLSPQSMLIIPKMISNSEYCNHPDDWVENGWLGGQACSNSDTSSGKKRESITNSGMISKHSNPSRYKDRVSSFYHDPVAPSLNDNLNGKLVPATPPHRHTPPSQTISSSLITFQQNISHLSHQELKIKVLISDGWMERCKMMRIYASLIWLSCRDRFQSMNIHHDNIVSGR